MAGIKEIRTRIDSVQQTLKITNAMYLISSSKLRRARQQLNSVQPYFMKISSTIADILHHSPEIEHIYFDKRPERKHRRAGYIVITGDKGLAGAYNHNVLRQAEERLAQEGAAALLAELAAVDPETAARLHLRDEKRILRALEVYRETGETISEHDRKSRETPDRYDALYIGLSFRDRQDLRDRIDRRVDAMVAQGLLDEVRRLLGSGLPRDATALQAIGFKQFLAVADGTATEAEAVEEVKLRSRQYAKRQLTWLRRNPDIHWILWEKEPDFPWALQNATDFLTAAGVC